jgi:amphiphysin
MMEEVKDIDRKLVVPAQLARDALKPMEKAIKKRDDAKVRRPSFRPFCYADS